MVFSQRRHPEHPEKIQIDATISVASIDTDNEKRDAHLRSADFFDVESHPYITFKSTGAEIRKECVGHPAQQNARREPPAERVVHARLLFK